MKKKLVAISGSLRKMSVNSAILRTVAQRAPTEVEVEVLDISDVPLYNEDIETDPPAAVTALWHTVRNSDGVILASPEYNHGTSGVMKNVLDWLSRPYGDAPLTGKKVLVLASSSAFTGGARSYPQLNATLDGMRADRLDYPQILIAQADRKVIDSVFVDEETLSFILTAIAHF